MDNESQILKKTPPKVVSLKVGIHEWIVVDSTMLKLITLWTDGLVGCVGVAISTPTHAFITHIYSDLTKENWDKTVTNEFSNAISTIIDISEATACLVVSGDNPELADSIYPSIEQILKEKAKNCRLSREYNKPGVSAYLGNSGPRIQALASYQKELMIGGINSSEAAAFFIKKGIQYLEKQGFFTGEVQGYQADFGRD